jgi:hypothetical protein
MEYCENFRHAKEEVRKRMTGVNSSWIRTRTQIGFMRDIEETLPKKIPNGSGRQPTRKDTSPALPSAATQSSLRYSAHCGHDKITRRIVSSPCLHSHRALSTKPPLERYRFDRQCPILAWMRIADWSDFSDPYSRRVCVPGRA